MYELLSFSYSKKTLGKNTKQLKIDNGSDANIMNLFNLTELNTLYLKENQIKATTKTSKARASELFITIILFRNVNKYMNKINIAAITLMFDNFSWYSFTIPLFAPLE